MKLVIIEPLGVSEDKLKSIINETLADHSPEIISYDARTTDTQELIARGQDADIIVETNLPLNAQVIEGCKKLKLLSVAFTGVDHVDLDACRAKGVTVCNCAGYSTAAVADLVFGLLINLYRNILPCNDRTRHSGTKDGLIGFELEGKAFGIVGTGAIGLRVAAIAQAFGCHVYAYSRTVKDIPGITYVSLDELMRSCDIISLHTPMNVETKHLINAKNIALMKSSAVLINTARGGVVDSQALADALNEGRIAGAGIDVFESEPPIDGNHPLLNSKNTLLTPHVAFATKEALEKRAVIVFDNVAKYLQGIPQNTIY